MSATELSPREMEVAAGVHQDHGNKRIAADLGCAETTVKTHLVRIMRKLGVESRVGVALWYERQNRKEERLAHLALRVREAAKLFEDLP